MASGPKQVPEAIPMFDTVSEACEGLSALDRRHCSSNENLSLSAEASSAQRTP